VSGGAGVGPRCESVIWRARIGILFPADGANDDDFWRLVPSGVTVHVARTRPLTDDFSVEAYGRLAGEDVESQAELLGFIRPSSVAYACTSGSFIRGVDYDRDIGARIRRASGAPATTTSTAMLNALRALGVRRVAVATPYRDVINQRLTAFLVASGFSVERNMGLGLDDWTINFVPQSDVYHLARKADTAAAEVLFIACTNLRALDVIEPLEKDLAKPVITANQATMWEALRLAGIRDRPKGFGTLFALHQTSEHAAEA
jgi:maleate isomerase